MNAIIIAVSVIAAIIIIVTEISIAINSHRYGIRYTPMIVNLVNMIQFRKNPEGYMKYAYSMIVDQDKYFEQIKKSMLANGIDVEYIDNLIVLSKNMMNA